MANGAFRRHDLVPETCADHDLRRSVRRQELRRAFRGVYVPADAALPATWAAALAGAGPDARLSHLTALVAYDVPLRCACVADADVHITTPRHLRRRAGLSPHRRLEVRASVVRDGLHVVRLAEAVVGSWPLLCESCRKELLCSLQRRRRLPVRAIDEELSRWGRLTGRAQLLDYLRLVEQGCHSPIEIDFVLLVERPFRLPRAGRQTRFRRRLLAAFGDVYYEAARLLVELDGREHHGDDDQRRADLARDLELAARHGIQTLRITGRQLREDPAWVAEAILAVLEQRSGQVGS